MPALVLRKREPAHEPPYLGDVIVKDCRLEVLANRQRLAELAAEPAKEVNRGEPGCHQLDSRPKPKSVRRNRFSGIDH